jgi:hypothetical protein
MMKRFGGITCILLILSLVIISWTPAKSVNKKLPHMASAARPLAAREQFEHYIENVYDAAGLRDSGLAFTLFKKAITGFTNLKASAKITQSNSILAVIDFSKSSCEKRMWIIDVVNKSLLLHTWVAHGEMSGNDIPTHFSDREDSRESSLGFYLTSDVYFGEHGRSLKLDGMDEGFNGNARKRAIVIHAADYVCREVIDVHGRLGRSYGCPAVSPEVIDQVIDALKDRTVLFVSGNSARYHSKYLNEDMAADYAASDVNNGSLASL